MLAVPPQAISTVHGIDYVRLSAAGGPMDVAVIPGESVDEGGQALVEILTGLHDGDRVLVP